MKKETIKTITLALLVTSSIILTINNWFSEKLWPDGYNFFSNLTNYFSTSKEPESFFLSKENVSNPAEIIVNNNEKRGVYTHSSSDFNDMVGTVKSLLKTGLLEKANVTEGSTDSWKQALKNKSIYFSYPIPYGTKTFSAILDSPINAIPAGTVQEFVLVSGDNITGKPHLIIKNAQDGTFTDVTLPCDSTKIDALIDAYALSSAGEYPYSFELNFDRADDSKDQKITIDSQVVFAINPITKPSVSEINYFHDIWENEDLYTEFLRGFGFNVSNIRKNVNLDNSIVFAENYGTIKLYPDGLLEFKALNDSSGISLGSSPELYDTFIGCIEFVNNVWDIACHEENMNINISSAKSNDAEGSLSITIDYYAEGTEVVTGIKATDSHPQLNHAIEIEVKNSRIVSYRQAIKGYRPDGDITTCTGVIDALDTLMANESIKSDNITDLYIAYYTDNHGVCSPVWVARTSKNEMRIIKN